MSYPPQPPQQPPPGGFYGPGGYQQPGYQPPPPPGYQPPPGYPPPGPPGAGGFPAPGGYPQPPRRPNRAPWIVGGVVLVLAAAVVLVGGFVWPGWFRPADDNLPHGHNSLVGVASQAQLFATVATDATAHNRSALQALACPASDLEGLDQFVTATKVTQQSVKQNGPTGAVEEIRVDTPNAALLYAVGTTNQLTGRWCIASITPGGTAN